MTRDEVEQLLEVHSVEELLSVSDLDMIDALVILYNVGQLQEPQVKPL